MSPRRARLFVPMLLAALVGSGCGRSPRAEETWRETGFVRHLSARTEACVVLHGGGVWGPGLAAAWHPLLADTKQWSGTPAGRVLEAVLGAPQTGALTSAVLASAGDEVCLAFGSGTAGQLAALQQVKRLFEAARIRNLFTPMPVSDLVPPETEAPAEELPDDLADAAFTEVMIPLPPAMQEALENFVREAAIPPVLAAFKSPGGDPPLAAFLREWVDGLPAAIPRDTIEVAGHGTFARVRLPVASVVPREAAVRARDILAANIGDPYAATYIIRDLMAKTTTLCFGRVHDYFIVSVGPEDPLAGLAPAFAQSLPAAGALDRLAPLAGGATALLYADPLVVSLAAAPPPVGEYLDAALEAALEFAPANRIRSLRETAAPLRAQAAELFHPRLAALSGVVRQENDRWTAELFGGSFAPRLAPANAKPLLAADADAALIWTEHWEADYAGRLAAFVAGAAAFADEWIEALGPVFLEDAARDRTRRLIGMFSGLLAPFREGSVETLEKALDRHVAFVLGLDGIMPGPPFTPPAAAKAVLPRLAIGAGLRDQGALAELPAQMMNNRDSISIGPPQTATEGGLTTSSYPIPLAGPDLAPAVTVGHGRWILGTSPSFTATVAAAPRPPGGSLSVQSIELNTAAFADFATAWAAALEEDGNLAFYAMGLMPTDPATLRAAAAMLQTPRHFAYEARWDGQTLHRVIRLHPSP
ncbi:MAG: hypothetical protein WEC73_02125 [Chthoniobacterales bacterium]